MNAMHTGKPAGATPVLGAVVVAIFGLAVAWTLAADTAGAGVNEPAARFRGPLTYDFGVTNVKWEAATPEYSYVTFDLYWSYSWRAKWTEPAATSATGKDMEVENWDAAWVFVKFLPDKDSDEAGERNHWLHATLDRDSANHVMPAGATNTVKMSDDGARGMGVFIYRDAVGHGANDWKNIKLRWNHGADPSTGLGAGKFDPSKADVKVHAIPMVYIPAGPFKVGSGRPSGIYQKFADGPDMPAVNNMANNRSRDQEYSGLTDGSWRGGNSIPFLLDAEWSAPAKEGTRARRLGIAPGELWCTHTFWEVNLSWIGTSGTLPDEYPAGYESFYCMKYELTQGQYVDFLNSLPPDVAAERAFVGGEVSSDAGMHRGGWKLDLGPGRGTVELVENGGCTIYSSADFPEKVDAQEPDTRSEEQKKKEGAVEDLLNETFDDKKGGKKKGVAASAARPVYTARLPFRRARGTTSSDAYAYGVWAGLRPMSQLEAQKAGNGVRDPVAPPDWTGRPDLDGKQVIADLGLPTERFTQGNSQYGSDIGLRVGCFSSPTSDRGTALATYWGISELNGTVVPIGNTAFRGTHGNGMTSPGKPGAPVKRTIAKFNGAPADWPPLWAYIGGHYVGGSTRLVISAGNRILKPAVEPAAAAAKPKKEPLPLPPQDGRKDDLPRISNVKVEAGKEFSTVSFDLAWNNSWRVKWTEPAEKNCAGKPLTMESWDAAWVFVKFRPKGETVFSHAMLSPDEAHHAKPAGATLEMGLSDAPSTGIGAGGAKGIGVFIYRDAVGQGANDFKGIKVRWQHTPAAPGAEPVDPATAELSVHAIAMVYVPDGPFRSKSPFIYSTHSSGSWTPGAYECRLTTIDTPDTTKPGGHVNVSTNYVREGPDWPNGYSAFYCMKYSISQGEYARFLTEQAPDLAKANYNGQYGYGPHNAFRRYAGGLYGLSGYAIRYIRDEMRYEADVPERPAKFLSDADINSFVAWAGLRQVTCLEYEKACRGPRAVAKEEDAWAAGACAPADGLAKSVPSLGRQDLPTTGRMAWPGPSYWGIRDMSQSGAVIEWPAVVIEDGRGFTGEHGTGSPNPPNGWVFTSRGEWYVMGMWQGLPLSEIGVWILPEDCTSFPPDIGAYISTRSGRYGARGVRTAGSRADRESPLQVDALPNLVGCDIAVVNLSGRFKNDGDKPLRVELVSALPAGWFLKGDASRAFTAAAKAVTPFKVPLVLTRELANVTRRGSRSLFLPLRVQGPGGESLAETKIRLPSDVLSRSPLIVESLAGGKIDLRVTNATENAVTLALEMPSCPAVKIGETKRGLTLPAGATGVAEFPVPRQAFPSGGVCVVPYRLTVGNGPAVAAQATVDLRPRTRWWLVRRQQTGPKAGESGVETASGGVGDIDGLDEVAGGEVAVFNAPALPKGWARMTSDGSLLLTTNETLATHGSVLAAATRVEAPSERDAVVKLSHQTVGRFLTRVWVNHKVVYECPPPPPRSAKTNDRPTPTVKPFRLRKGVNTLVVECHSRDDAPAVPGRIDLEFRDPKSNEKQTDLALDMESGLTR